MAKIDAEKEFANQIEKYLVHYGLQESDLGKLIGTGAKDVIDIVNSERVVGFKRGERISNVFGMRYFEFGNPNFPFNEFDKLPIRTQEVIMDRKKSGPKDISKKKDLNLNAHINVALSSGKLNDEFTSADVLMLLPDDISSQIEAKRITHLFRNGPFENKVQNTGKVKKNEKSKRKGHILYRLKP